MIRILAAATIFATGFTIGAALLWFALPQCRPVPLAWRMTEHADHVEWSRPDAPVLGVPYPRSAMR